MNWCYFWGFFSGWFRGVGLLGWVIVMDLGGFLVSVISLG